MANLMYQSRMSVNYRSKHMIAPIKKTIVTKIKNKSERFTVQPNKLDEHIQTSLLNEKRVIRSMSEEASLVMCYTCTVWRRPRPTCPLRPAKPLTKTWCINKHAVKFEQRQSTSGMLNRYLF